MTNVVDPYFLDVGEIQSGDTMADYEEPCAFGVDVWGVDDLGASSDGSCDCDVMKLSLGTCERTEACVVWKKTGLDLAARKVTELRFEVSVGWLR